jgi:hypothetical protein
MVIASAPLIRAARAMAAELVEAMTGRAEDVDVHFELPDDVRVAVDHARATTAEAKRLAAVAAEGYRQAVRDLMVGRGMSKADVAALLQVSSSGSANVLRSLPAS